MRVVITGATGNVGTSVVSADDDPLGVEDFATHHVPLDEAPEAYEMFQKKEDGAFKVVFKP